MSGHLSFSQDCYRAARPEDYERDARHDEGAGLTIERHVAIEAQVAAFKARLARLGAAPLWPVAVGTGAAA